MSIDEKKLYNYIYGRVKRHGTVMINVSVDIDYQKILLEAASKLNKSWLIVVDEVSKYNEWIKFTKVHDDINVIYAYDVEDYHARFIDLILDLGSANYSNDFCRATQTINYDSLWILNRDLKLVLSQYVYDRLLAEGGLFNIHLNQNLVSELAIGEAPEIYLISAELNSTLEQEVYHYKTGIPVKKVQIPISYRHFKPQNFPNSDVTLRITPKDLYQLLYNKYKFLGSRSRELCNSLALTMARKSYTEVDNYLKSKRTIIISNILRWKRKNDSVLVYSPEYTIEDKDYIEKVDSSLTDFIEKGCDPNVKWAVIESFNQEYIHTVVCDEFVEELVPGSDLIVLNGLGIHTKGLIKKILNIDPYAKIIIPYIVETKDDRVIDWISKDFKCTLITPSQVETIYK